MQWTHSHWTARGSVYHVSGSYVYARIDKAWYGLKEAGRIAGDDIRGHLATFGYHESKFIPGFFTHDTRPINFTLVVDDFGVKYKYLVDRLVQKIGNEYFETRDTRCY